MYKYALLFALAGGAALFTGCRADEEVDLAGYPETPVGATISGTTDRVATFAGTYDNEGVLNLAGSLSGEYTIALAQASPEETVVRVEPIITNVPAELVEISARELVIPAGSTTAAVSVRMIEENYDFMENVFGPVTYELGVRVVEARGSQVPVVDGEAKMVIEKAAYVAVASLVGVEGNAVTFKRNFIDGAIVNEDPITYDVKVVVDRPVLEDTKFVVKSAGIPEGFADDERFTPAAEVTIPAGAKESDATTWSVTDDFLEADEELGTFPVQLTADINILVDLHIEDRVQFLMDHGNAALHRFARAARRKLFPLDQYLAGVGIVDAHQDFHQRGLARAVLPHKCMHRAAANLQGYVIEYFDAGKGFCDVVHFQNKFRHPDITSSCKLCSGSLPPLPVIILAISFCTYNGTQFTFGG